jgi:hypothetical protein
VRDSTFLFVAGIVLGVTATVLLAFGVLYHAA